MTERKPLFMNDTEGYSEEMSITDSMVLGGLTMGGDIALDGYKVTGSSLGPFNSGDLVPKDYVDDAISLGITEAPKVENTLVVLEAISVGDPVYFTSTNNNIGKGDTTDLKSKIIGVARTAQATPGLTCEIVTAGPCVGCLVGAIAGTAYFLQTGGGVGTAIPGSSKRVIQVGISINATDLFVRIIDLGKKA